MPHFNRKTGAAVEILSMSNDTVFKAGAGKPKTWPTHDFNATFRPGKPYETASGKFDYPEGYHAPAVEEDEAVSENA